MIQPYKVHLSVDLLPLIKLTAHTWIKAMFPGSVQDMIEGAIAESRNDLLDYARQRIVELDRQADHLCNLYLNWDGISNNAEATYVFSDRDTALLFKLSR